MAQKDITLAVKAQIQADASSIKQAITEFQEAIGGSLKVDTGLEKSIIKQLDKIKDKAADFTLIGEQNIISRADLNTAERTAKDIFRRLAKIADQYKNAGTGFFEFSKEDEEKIKKLEERYKNIETGQSRTDKRNLKESLKNTEKVNQSTYSKINYRASKANLKIQDTDTISSYKGRITSAKKAAEERLAIINDNDKNEQSLAAATKALAEAAKNLAKNAETERARQIKSYSATKSVAGKAFSTEGQKMASGQRYYDLASQLASVKFTSNAGLQSYLKGLVFQEGTTDFLKNGNITYGDENAYSLLRLIGIDENTIQQAIAGKDAFGNATSLAKLYQDTIQKIGLKQFRGDVRPRAAAVSTTVENGVEKATSQEQTAYNGLEKKVSNLEAEKSVTETLLEHLNELSARVAELEKAYLEVDDATAREESRAAHAELNEAKETAKQNVMGDPTPSVRSVEGAAINERLQNENQKDSDRAEREADNFKSRLQQAVKQWMGAREIINYVKKGIKSAYQDIQNLDKAMTNIAVVTDFSTEDLWGQINDYMAIAKQYGVTTQGVYEVTQLFFQQGLGTSDTMAATVETLKMARIAGINYTDAADGMTVA